MGAAGSLHDTGQTAVERNAVWELNAGVIFWMVQAFWDRI